MKIIVEKLRKIESINNNVNGITNILLNDSLVVENIKIIEGENGYFVAMPSRQKTDGTFKDIVHPTTKDLAINITKTILDAFNYGSYNQGNLEEFHVTDVKIYLISNPETNIKGISSVVLNNEFVINDIKIIEEFVNGQKTYKIYMPTWKYKEELRNVAYAIDKKLVEEIINKVIDKYKEEVKPKEPSMDNNAKEVKTFIVSELVNLAEITLIANCYLKKNEFYGDILHDYGEYDYHFEFMDCEKRTVKEWVEELKRRGIEDIYIDFLPPKDISTLACENGTPARLVCKYKSGDISVFTKRWIRKQEKNFIYDVIYQESLIPSKYYNNGFVNYFEKNFTYFQNSIKELINFSEKLELYDWKKFFEGALELNNIEKAKEFLPTQKLYKKIPDINVCCFAMAIQAYPFGGMGSWCDVPYGIAQAKKLDNEYETYSYHIWAELMGMISYATNKVV